MIFRAHQLINDGYF